MSATRRQPDFFYGNSTEPLTDHLIKLTKHVATLAHTLGFEPTDLMTSWQDGEEPSEHNGWMTIIKWPYVITDRSGQAKEAIE